MIFEAMEILADETEHEEPDELGEIREQGGKVL
jgi:hypothetical protein